MKEYDDKVLKKPSPGAYLIKYTEKIDRRFEKYNRAHSRYLDYSFPPVRDASEYYKDRDINMLREIVQDNFSEARRNLADMKHQLSKIAKYSAHLNGKA